jgi:hypothetical protein
MTKIGSGEHDIGLFWHAFECALVGDLPQLLSMRKCLTIVASGIGDDPLRFEERDGASFDDDPWKAAAVERDPADAMSGRGDSTEKRLALGKSPQCRRERLPISVLAPREAAIRDDPTEMTTSLIDVVLRGFEHREEEADTVLHEALRNAVPNTIDDIAPGRLDARRLSKPLSEAFDVHQQLAKAGVPGEVIATPELKELPCEPVHVIEQRSQFGSQHRTGNFECHFDIAGQASPLIDSPCDRAGMAEGKCQLTQTRD